MLIIKGDGSYQNTKVFIDDNEVKDIKLIEIWADLDKIAVVINSELVEGLGNIALLGEYTLLSDGTPENTLLFAGESMLRGVQSFRVVISKDYHPTLEVSSIFLPNIVPVINN